MDDYLKTVKGPIAWMVKNPVAANLLMLLCLVGGFAMFKTIKQEVFPDLTVDVVSGRDDQDVSLTRNRLHSRPEAGRVNAIVIGYQY